MPVEVLLMADVEKLGAEGDVVKVADGYARNYLFPQKLAAPVMEATRRKLAKMRENREVQRKIDLDAAKALALQIEKVSCTIPAKTADDGKLYGSVSSADIAANLKTQGIEVDKQQILLDAPIKELGVFNVKIKLHPEMEPVVRVWVVEG
jgi:large subunit ribosomal protein L9